MPVLVYLPPGYRDGRERLPVLYLQDGQNLFDPATAFAGSWHAGRTLDRQARRGRPVIAVAIPNAGVGRIHEYSPFRDRRHGGGGGDAYLEWLTERVQPLVERSFRVAREPESTAIAGASMGGLISNLVASQRPDLVEQTEAHPWRIGATSEIHAHEFHYSTLENADPALQYAYRVKRGHRLVAFQLVGP